MAIQPIDLQTLYGQLDKIGKTQVQQQQTAQAARDAEQLANKQATEQKMKTVKETETDDSRTGLVHERDGPPDQSGGSNKEKKKDEPEAPLPEEAKKEIIKDPALGKHIDISG